MVKYLKKVVVHILKVHPLTSKNVYKKTLRMMKVLMSEYGSVNLVYRIYNEISECIKYRSMINSGIIPFGIDYDIDEIMRITGDKNKWAFKNKVKLASRQSLNKWEYMRFILGTAISDSKISKDRLDNRCSRALFELSICNELGVNIRKSLMSNSNISKINIGNVDGIRYM